MRKDLDYMLRRLKSRSRVLVTDWLSRIFETKRCAICGAPTAHLGRIDQGQAR
jgi:hypothetical protein